MGPLVLSLDVEEHRPHDGIESRVALMTRRILRFLDEHACRATVFVVGDLIDDHRDLVAEIAARGHELGLHSWHHRPLVEAERVELTDQLRRGREALEDLAGRPVVGFRAPTFSLVPESAWVTEVLAECGFGYSSSVLPAANPLFGWPGAPRAPFRWPSGVVEFPAPVLGVGRFALPVLGGVYFRVLPAVVSSAGLRRSRTVPFLYCHPYDFDPDERFWVVPGTGRLGSRLLWVNRRRMFAKVERLTAGETATFADLLDDHLAAPTFDPGRVAA